MTIIKLLDLLNNKFGSAWLEIEEPETLSLMLEKVNFDTTKIEIINALKTLLVSKSAWMKYPVFENIVDALNENPVIPSVTTCPHIVDVAITYGIMETIAPDNQFSDEVHKYIASLAKSEMLISLPKPLTRANKYIQVLRENQPLKDELDAFALNIDSAEKIHPITSTSDHLKNMMINIYTYYKRTR